MNNNGTSLPCVLDKVPYSLLLVENIQEYAIFMMDTTGHVLSWNLGAKNIKGYTFEEIIGKPFSLFYLSEDNVSGKISKELETAATTGKYEGEGWRLRKNGTSFWASIIINAIYDGNNEVLGFANITRDLTEKKKVEEKLTLSEERLRLLVESIKDYAVFMLDPQGNISSWNQAARCIKGYTSKEIIGKSFSVFYLPEDQEASKPYWALKLAIREGKYEGEGWRVRKDGSAFWASVVVTALYNDKGKLKGFNKITRDLSEKLQLQEDLLHIQQHNKLLLKNNEELNEFTQIIAHDFREPLRGISNFASILKYELEGRLSEEENHMLESLKKQALKMCGLLDSLLKISLVNYIAHKVSLTNLNSVVEEVIDILKHLLEENNIEVRIPRPLPTILCDPIKIREVFNNLITNAAKYNDKKEKWIEIGWSGQLLSRQEGDPVSGEEQELITLYVRDNGIGIQGKNFNTIFKPFKRLHGRDQYGDGTGIGLNLIKKIIKRHQGSIWVESQVGLGSTFFFSIPYSCQGSVAKNSE